MRLLLVAIGCAVSTPATAEPRPLRVRADLASEAAAIPFTRVVGDELHPGALAGIDWHVRWLKRPSVAFFQTSYLMTFSHGRIERGLLFGYELGLRGTLRFGLTGELTLGAGYLRAFSGSPRYEKDATGSYVQVRDWGRPRFSPSFHTGVGYDLSRRSELPVTVMLEYGSFMEIPYSSTMFPVLPHITLGLSLRYAFRGSWR